MRNVRTDSWASSLTEEQSWQLYYKSRALRWNEAADWAVKEYGVEAPSRTAFYAWLAHMRGIESAHRLEQAATAAAEAAALAKTKTSDDALIAAYKAMGAELALRTGSAGEAGKFVQMAGALADRRLRAEELKLKARAQSTKDEQLKLAREKFQAAERRENAAKGTLADERLTPDEKLKELDRLFGR
jgi:hypothetical protein